MMIAKSPRIRSNARSPQRSNRRSAIMLSGIECSSVAAMPKSLTQLGPVIDAAIEQHDKPIGEEEGLALK